KTSTTPESSLAEAASPTSRLTDDPWGSVAPSPAGADGFCGSVDFREAGVDDADLLVVRRPRFSACREHAQAELGFAPAIPHIVGHLLERQLRNMTALGSSLPGRQRQRR